MFGYFEKSPWSPDDSMMLISRIPSYNQSLSLDMRADIGLLRLPREGQPREFRWEKIETTAAWNHQQGAMIQWLGVSNELILFNDCGCDGSDVLSSASRDSFCAVIYNINTRQRVRTLPMPVYHMNRAGTVAVAINFGRLQLTRAGYGYAVTGDKLKAEFGKRLPDDDGIFVMDLTQPEVKPRLLVSMRRVWEHLAAGEAKDPITGLRYAGGQPSREWYDSAVKYCLHWVNHAQLNREGTHVTFLYRAGHCKECGAFRTWAYMVEIATGELWRIPLYTGSHHDFGWDYTAIMCDHTGYYDVKYKERTVRLGLPWPDAMSKSADLNGHCSYAANTDRLILTDTYPLPLTQERLLFIWDRTHNRTDVVGAFRRMLEGNTLAVRVDLHPRWNRDGRYICFDSTHEGVGRQVYVAKVAERKSVLRRDFTEPPKKVFIDLGARTGDTLAQLLLVKPDASDYTVYAFECNPENKAHVERNVELMGNKVRRMELLFAAAWTEDGTISFHMDTRAKGADGQVGKTGGSLFDSPYAKGTLVTVPAVDFSRWLPTKVTYEDYVECKIDIEGAEFELLERMFKDGSVLLCDVMRVEWHERFRKEYAGYPQVYAELFSKLGTQYYSHW